MSDCQTKTKLKIALEALESISAKYVKDLSKMSKASVEIELIASQIEASAALEQIKEMGETCPVK